jgi:hypothetical protein
VTEPSPEKENGSQWMVTICGSGTWGSARREDQKIWDSRGGYFGESQKVELARWQALPELTGMSL